MQKAAKLFLSSILGCDFLKEAAFEMKFEFNYDIEVLLFADKEHKKIKQQLQQQQQQHQPL